MRILKWTNLDDRMLTRSSAPQSKLFQTGPNGVAFTFHQFRQLSPDRLSDMLEVTPLLVLGYI